MGIASLNPSYGALYLLDGADLIRESRRNLRLSRTRSAPTGENAMPPSKL